MFELRTAALAMIHTGRAAGISRVSNEMLRAVTITPQTAVCVRRFPKKGLLSEARPALKIPSGAKNPDGNGISVGVEERPTEFFPINISIYFSKYI